MDAILWGCPESLAAVAAVGSTGEALRQGRQQDFGFALQRPGRVEDEEPTAVEPRRIARVVDEKLEPQARARAFPIQPCRDRIDGLRILDGIPSRIDAGRPLLERGEEFGSE